MKRHRSRSGVEAKRRRARIKRRIDTRLWRTRLRIRRAVAGGTLDNRDDVGTPWSERYSAEFVRSAIRHGYSPKQILPVHVSSYLDEDYLRCDWPTHTRSIFLTTRERRILLRMGLRNEKHHIQEESVLAQLPVAITISI